MADIFMSYAREDEAKIKALVAALQAQGWSVFWDRRIPTGETWRGFLGSALESARCVIVAWSRHSVDSQWVAEEADDGKARQILLPILLDRIQPPHGFREIQAADLSSWQPGQASENFGSLVADLRRLLEKRPVPLGRDVASPAVTQPNNVPENPQRPPTGQRHLVLSGLIAIAAAGIALYWFGPGNFHQKVTAVQPSTAVVPERPPEPSVSDRQLEPAAPKPPVATGVPKDSWVVVTASFKRFERQRAEDQLAKLKRAGIPATILDSNDYPLLTPDLWVVAVGPFTSKQEANAALVQVKSSVPDAYVKKGH